MKGSNMAKKAEKKTAVKNYKLNDDEGRANYDIAAILDDEKETNEAMQDNDNYNRISYPPMVLPNLIPDGKSIRGVLLSSRPSQKYKKQQILLIRMSKTGQEISLPASRGIGVYLFDKDTGELKEEFLNKEIVIRRKGSKYSEQNQKEYPIFDVLIGKKSVD